MRKGEEKGEREEMKVGREETYFAKFCSSSPKLEYHTHVFAWRWCLQIDTLTRSCKSKSKFCMDGTIQDSTANEVYR